MSFGSPAPTPAPPPLPDPVAAPPTLANYNMSKPTGNANKIPSFGGTLLTSGEGVTAPSPTAKKSLLGQ